MPIDNVTFFTANASNVVIQGFADTVVLTIDIRPTDVGKFVVLARVVLDNWDGDAQFASARLTMLAGKKEIDRVDTRIAGRSDGNVQSVSLQAVLELGQSQLSIFGARHIKEGQARPRCSWYV
jgi:hypothetical protein